MPPIQNVMDYVSPPLKGLFFVLAGIFISGGCSSSPKSAPASPVDVLANVSVQELRPPKLPTYDPFLENVSRTQNNAASIWDSVKTSAEENKEESKESKKEVLTPPPPPKDVRSKILQELESGTGKITFAEEEEVLSKDLWVKNILLDRLRDNGANGNKAGRSNGDRKRAEEIHKLNLSNKERRKQHNGDYVYESDASSAWRWFHRELEQLAAVPAEERENPAVFLYEKKYQNKNYRVLRANTAIMLGRTPAQEPETDSPGADLVPILLGIVRDSSLRTELRCAAAETLGKHPDVQPDILIPLLEHYKEKVTETVDPKTGLVVKKPQNGIPLLWMELLTAISEKTEPWEHPCFLEPFSARDYDTRLQIAKIWRRRSDLCNDKLPRLPQEYLTLLRQEPSPAIRAEMIRTLGVWKEPRIFEFVAADLNRETLVRNAAMDALADAGCKEAAPAIQQKLSDPIASNRLKAIRTLAAIGSLEEIHKLLNDPDAEVRKAAAEVLGKNVRKTAALQDSEPEDILPLLSRLESENAAERRKASAEILQLSEVKKLDRSAQNRILKCAQTETDVFTSEALFNVLKSSNSTAARQIAETFRCSELPELRKIYGEAMGELGTPDDLPTLAEQLDDSNRSVVAASISAMMSILRKQDEETLQRAKDILRELAEHLKMRQERNGNPRFEVDTGAVLHIMNDPGGTEMLRRILHTGDVSMKCYAVRKIGDLEDPIFVPELIQLLDDGNGSVRLAALNALPKVAGEDFGTFQTADIPGTADNFSTPQKIEHWKRWAANR